MTYRGSKVLITGHTGFKGSWLSVWLNMLGAKVCGISLSEIAQLSHYKFIKKETFESEYFCDVTDIDRLKEIFAIEKPDFVFHLAAQALVKTSIDDPLETIKTNAFGTMCILEAIRYLNKPVTSVLITSDKVYENVEWNYGYREIDALGGRDPYSASKSMAEIGISSFLRTFEREFSDQKRVAVGRAGNVIGGGDWAENRIIPDCFRAWSSGASVKIRSPYATRPWQHVLEPLFGYLLLGTKLSKNISLHGEAFNFGPHKQSNVTVGELIYSLNDMRRKPINNPIKIEEESHQGEAKLLHLNSEKAYHYLGWVPTLDLTCTLRYIADWYDQFYDNSGASMLDLTMTQISQFMDACNYAD